MNLEEKLANARDVHRGGNIDAAVPVYQEILAEMPEHVGALHLLGVAKLQKGDPAGAIESIAHAVVLKDDDARMHNNLGSAFMALGKIDEAVEAFRKSEELDPLFPDAPYNLGNALRVLRKYEASMAAYNRAIAHDANNPEAHNNLGGLYMVLNRYEEALTEYRLAHDLAPGSADILSNLVIMLEQINRLEEAGRLSEKLLGLAPNHPTARYIRARLERRDGNLETAQQLVDSVLAESLQPLLRISALFEQSRILDLREEYALAFAAVQEAKSIRLTLPDVQGRDITKYRRRVSAICEDISSDSIAGGQIAAGGYPAEPVFFVGFARSGTTLMEQILASHPAFVTTGEKTPLTAMIRKAEELIGRKLDTPVGALELSDNEVSVLREVFFHVAREVTSNDLTERRVVDKMPMNIVDLGIINRVFPDAKILVAIRDPRDTCLSCYLQFFQPNKAMSSFMSLQNTGETYAAVMGLWLRYREILTVPWLEYRYEDLTGGFDETLARVLDFLGVEWTDSVRQYAETARNRGISTPSYAMVTENITNKAVGRWRNYEKELAPILPILEPFVKEFGYEPS